jgi:hypothetical protein
MTQGERAIRQEQRRMEKEKKRRIELANKMLIPVGEKTSQSLGLLSFDPSGVFRLGNNLWLKVFTIDEAKNVAEDVAQKILGTLRMTIYLSESGKATCHLSLIEEGEIYEEVREKFVADEAVLLNAKVMTVDDVMGSISANFYKDIRFSYASFVRGKKDWKKECFHEIEESQASFKMGRLFGESMMAISYADEIAAIDISDLSALSCPMYISYQWKSLKDEAEIYFKRYLEKQYNRKLLDMGDDSLINQSLSISFFCDSLDAREIVESTLCSYFLNKGILLVPGFGNQRTIAESSLSYGLIGYDLYRNVDLEIAKNMIGGGNNESSKVEV